MITDIETNKVYLSSLIKDKKFEPFWIELGKILSKHQIRPSFIDGTRSIWCRDYMPIQISEKDFAQFKYFPDYCLSHKEIAKLTIQDEMVYDIPHGINIRHIDLIVDGGNVIKSRNKAIMTKKVFLENKNRTEKSIVDILRRSLKVDEIHFLPIQPYDYTGHADGMVRLLDDDNLLINDFSMESPSWRKEFDKAIDKIGIEPTAFPYAHSNRKVDGDWTAEGCYINYAQIGNVILFPQFGMEKDEDALNAIKKLYSDPSIHIEPINAVLLAEGGGVLNCMTWNVFNPVIKNAVNDIIPAFGNKDHLIVIHKDESRPIKDTVCIELFPEKGIIGGSWSLQKLIKRVEPIAEIGANELHSYQQILSTTFTPEQLTDILNSLLTPAKGVLNELIDIPQRLKNHTI